MDSTVANLSERIQTLTSEQLAEVELFVNSLQNDARGPSLRRASAVLSGPAFEAIWSNPQDDAYDAL